MQTPVVPANIYEVLCNKLLNLPFSKVALVRTGVKSTCMDQVLLLGKMDARMLKDKTENKNDFYAHECENCGMLMNFQWKVRGTYKNKHEKVGGSYHAACAARHPENDFNESGHNPIQ